MRTAVRAGPRVAIRFAVRLVSAPMKTDAIVAGGGWSGTQIKRVRVRARVAFLVAVALLCISVAGARSWAACFIVPAGVSFVVALVLAVQEPPRELVWPKGWPMGKEDLKRKDDPRCLYAAVDVDPATQKQDGGRPAKQKALASGRHLH